MRRWADAEHLVVGLRMDVRRGGEVTPVVSSDPVATSTHHIRRVPDDLWRRISVAAVSRGMTRSAIVIEALAEWGWPE